MLCDVALYSSFVGFWAAGPCKLLFKSSHGIFYTIDHNVQKSATSSRLQAVKPIWNNSNASLGCSDWELLLAERLFVQKMLDKGRDSESTFH